MSTISIQLSVLSLPTACRLFEIEFNPNTPARTRLVSWLARDISTNRIPPEQSTFPGWNVAESCAERDQKLNKLRLWRERQRGTRRWLVSYGGVQFLYISAASTSLPGASGGTTCMRAGKLMWALLCELWVGFCTQPQCIGAIVVLLNCWIG